MKPHNLGPDVLDHLGAVKANAAGGVTQEARDAKAHVLGVPKEHERGAITPMMTPAMIVIAFSFLLRFM